MSLSDVAELRLRMVSIGFLCCTGLSLPRAIA